MYVIYVIYVMYVMYVMYVIYVESRISCLDSGMVSYGF